MFVISDFDFKLNSDYQIIIIITKREYNCK